MARIGQDRPGEAGKARIGPDGRGVDWQGLAGVLDARGGA